MASRDYPEHVALHCRDIWSVAAHAAARGMGLPAGARQLLRRHRARLGIDADLVVRLHSAQLLYDRDPAGEFLHFYTRPVGRVFFEVVQRVGGYDGYGADNAPVRLASQARLDRVERDDNVGTRAGTRSGRRARPPR